MLASVAMSPIAMLRDFDVSMHVNAEGVFTPPAFLHKVSETGNAM